MGLYRYLLISDHDSLARSLLPQVLRKDDQLTCASPHDALAFMRQPEIDAILVAVEAANEDTVVTCRTVRRNSSAPIVMLVNPSSRDQIARGFRLGADACIELPCDPREFQARVTALLRRRALNARAIAPIPIPAPGA